jgi:putative phage-type endonuclease
MLAQQPVGELDRSSYFGSSDIAAIIGVSPWRTKLDVFLDKTKGREEITPEKSAIFKRGKRLEPYILDMYAEDTGESLIHRGERYIDLEYPFLAAEIDAETESGKNVEAKSARADWNKVWGSEMTDEIPVYYNAQAMFGMGINGAESAEFPVLIGIDDFRIYRVERDQQIITNLKKAAVEFWNGHIITGIAPEPTTVGDIERMFPWDAGSVIQATDQIRDAYLDLKDLKKRIKFLEGDAEEAAKRIKLFMGEHQILKFGAEQLLSWKSQKARLFDAKAFTAKHPTIAEKFRYDSTSRVMRIK